MANVTIKSVNNIPRLMKVLNELESYAVEVGIFGDGEYGMIARVHEFGTTIQTKKASIVIPERSFMRSTFDEKEKEWSKFILKQLQNVLDFKIDVQTMLGRLGAKMVADIQEKITDIRTPPNAASTIAKKGSSNPLIDTGGLRMRITYRVVKV